MADAATALWLSPAAIVIDATIIRAVVLPSLMTMLGNANWWTPRFLRSRPADAGAPARAGPKALEPEPATRA